MLNYMQTRTNPFLDIVEFSLQHAAQLSNIEQT